MLKNTKAVGIAAAVTLLAGVALAPSATGVGQYLPLLTVSDSFVDAGEQVDYFIDDVRTGCKVTTKLGAKTKVDKAVGQTGDTRRIYGEVDSYIVAPIVAGEYTLRSRVNSDCKDDAGYSNTFRMTDLITVGEEVTVEEFEDEGNWESLPNGSVRIYGWVEDGAGAQDLGAVKVNFLVRGDVVATGYTDEDGYVVASIAKKYLNNRGNTNVKLKLSPNRVYFTTASFSVERIGG
jgi:hypothetical protein